MIIDKLTPAVFTQIMLNAAAFFCFGLGYRYSIGAFEFYSGLHSSIVPYLFPLSYSVHHTL
jgi:hypothetical protein